MKFRPMQATLRNESARAPTLRLLEGKNAALELSPGGLGAWILLFGSLCASGGHGVFLFCALTRLSKIPSSVELGGPLEAAVIAWFVVAGPLALLATLLRRAFTRLAPRWAWSLASLIALCSTAAFVIYVRAIALA